MHTQAILACFTVFLHETVIGIAQLAAERLIAGRTKPERIFAFRFGGMLAATTPCTLLFRGYQKRINVCVINALPEMDLVFRIELAPMEWVSIFTHYPPQHSTPVALQSARAETPPKTQISVV